MSKTPQSPERIILEFLSPSTEPVKLIDLGPDFLRDLNIQLESADRPFRVAIERKESKAGNAYYSYNQNAVPLPDKLGTLIRVEGVIVPLGRVQMSKSGHPMREGSADVVIGSILYTMTAYLSESRRPYFIKVIAHKKPDQTGLKKAQLTPKGGSII